MPTNNTSTPITNPLQTNNTALMAIGYAAGVLASKFPIFDSAIWQSILLAAGGLVFALYTAFTNRKSVVVSTVANMPEVNKVDLDKTVNGATALAAASPDNVVAK